MYDDLGRETNNAVHPRRRMERDREMKGGHSRQNKIK